MKRLRPYLAARNVEDLWNHHTQVMDGYGFDRLFYAYSCFRTKNLGDPNDALILTNHRPDYYDEYVNKGLFRHAPMTNWAARNTGAKSWRMMTQAFEAGEYSDKELQVVAINRRFGLKAGYTISFPMAIKNASAAIGLCAKPGLTHDDVDRIWDADGEEIEIFNHVAHLCIAQLPASGHNRILTPRQTEVLEHVADGKTVQDIATILGRNPATIDKHLRGARETLRVETTAQAVRKASMQNQIFLLDPSDRGA